MAAGKRAGSAAISGIARGCIGDVDNVGALEKRAALGEVARDAAAAETLGDRWRPLSL